MLHRMFCVFDKKAAAYLQPFFSPTVGVAVRSFTQAVNDRSTLFSSAPEDFQLAEVATFDDATGEVSPLVPVKVHVEACAIRKE